MRVLSPSDSTPWVKSVFQTPTAADLEGADLLAYFFSAREIRLPHSLLSKTTSSNSLHIGRRVNFGFPWHPSLCTESRGKEGTERRLGAKEFFSCIYFPPTRPGREGCQ